MSLAQYIVAHHALATLPFDEFLYNPKYAIMQKYTILQMVPAITQQSGLPSNLFSDIKNTSRLTIARKVNLEILRMKRRYIMPFWAKYIQKSTYKKVPFE